MRIPKGSYFYDGAKFMGITNKDFCEYYLPKANDYLPVIEKYTRIKSPIYVNDGNIIYVHPYFVKKGCVPKEISHIEHEILLDYQKRENENTANNF